MNKNLIFININKRFSNFKIEFFLNQFKKQINQYTDIIIICENIYSKRFRKFKTN